MATLIPPHKVAKISAEFAQLAELAGGDTEVIRISQELEARLGRSPHPDEIRQEICTQKAIPYDPPDPSADTPWWRHALKRLGI